MFITWLIFALWKGDGFYDILKSSIFVTDGIKSRVIPQIQNTDTPLLLQFYQTHDHGIIWSAPLTFWSLETGRTQCPMLRFQFKLQ